MAKGNLWVEVDENEPCNMVGVYTLQWGHAEEPEYFLIDADDILLDSFAAACREHPDGEPRELWRALINYE